MRSKRVLVVAGILLLALIAGGAAAYALLGQDKNPPPTSAAPPSASVQPTTPPSNAKASSPPASGTASPRPSQPGQSQGAVSPEDAVTRLADARRTNSKPEAMTVATEQAASQIFSYPPFNIHEGGVTCKRVGSESTCTVTSEAANLSMILKVKTDSNGYWKVQEIEPVID